MGEGCEGTQHGFHRPLKDWLCAGELGRHTCGWVKSAWDLLSEDLVVPWPPEVSGDPQLAAGIEEAKKMLATAGGDHQGSPACDAGGPDIPSFPRTRLHRV